MPNNKNNPEFSREREFKVILEDLQKQFRTFGEGLEGVQEGLDDVRQGLDDVRQRLGRVEVDIVQIKTDATELKLNMAFVKRVLPTLATKDDLLPLNKRLKVLEDAR